MNKKILSFISLFCLTLVLSVYYVIVPYNGAIKDESGNESRFECNFIVSSKSILGNIVDGNIKIQSSFIIVGVIICSLIIGLIKLRYDSKIKKKFKES